jgi:hypothetical protein
MKLPSFVENIVIRLALSRLGPLLTKGITAAAAAAVAYLATKVPGIEQYFNEYVLTGLLWWLIDFVYGKLPVEIQKRYGKELQEILNSRGGGLKVDGYVGPKTVAVAASEVR